MSEDARDRLCARGLDDIFDPALRVAIGELIDDVRQRGDAAVCDALARHDGVEVDPDGLRITDDELDAGLRRSLGRRRDRRRHHPSSGVQRAAARAHHRLELRVRTRVDRGREDHAGVVGGTVHTVGQGQLPERHLSTGRTGGRCRRAAAGARRAAGSRSWRRGRSGRARRVSQARPARGLPGQRPCRHRRLGFRHRVDPQGPQGRRPRLPGGHHRPGRDAATRRLDDDAARPHRESRHRRRHGRPGPAGGRPADRSRARNRFVGRAPHDIDRARRRHRCRLVDPLADLPDVRATAARAALGATAVV